VADYVETAVAISQATDNEVYGAQDMGYNEAGLQIFARQRGEDLYSEDGLACRSRPCATGGRSVPICSSRAERRVEGDGGHGGGDRLLLDNLFRGSHGAGDPLGRQAGLLDGIRSVAVGIAANRAISSGQVVPLADLDLPLRPVERSEART
jgi:hypothetical protein